MEDGEDNEMRKLDLFPRWVAWFLTSACIILSGRQICAATHSQRATQQSPSELYERVVEILLPFQNLEPNIFLDKVDWAVQLRITGPFDDAEYMAVIENLRGGGVTAHVMLASGRGIWSQLDEIQTKSPSLALEEVLSEVRIERGSLSEERCARLTQLAGEFEKLLFSPVVQDDLFLDSATYKLRSQSFNNKLSVELTGPGPSASRQTRPLLAWAEKARATTLKCLKRRR